MEESKMNFWMESLTGLGAALLALSFIALFAGFIIGILLLLYLAIEGVALIL